MRNLRIAVFGLMFLLSACVDGNRYYLSEFNVSYQKPADWMLLGPNEHGHFKRVLTPSDLDVLQAMLHYSYRVQIWAGPHQMARNQDVVLPDMMKDPRWMMNGSLAVFCADGDVMGLSGVQNDSELKWRGQNQLDASGYDADVDEAWVQNDHERKVYWLQWSKPLLEEDVLQTTVAAVYCGEGVWMYARFSDLEDGTAVGKEKIRDLIASVEPVQKDTTSLLIWGASGFIVLLFLAWVVGTVMRRQKPVHTVVLLRSEACADPSSTPESEVGSENQKRT